MSNLNKRVLAAALAVAIATPAAFAATITTTPVGGTPHAFELTATAPVSATNNAAINYNLVAGDILIGRTDASGNVNVRIDFVGATVGVAPLITVGAGQGALVGVPVFGGSTLTFVIAPPIAPGMIAGPLFTIGTNALAVTNATGLMSEGGTVNATIDVRDVTSGSVLQGAISGNIFTSVRSSAITNGAAATATADVVQGKTRFLVAGAAIDARNLFLGTVTVNPRAPVALTSARGSGFAGNTNADFGFQFDTVTAASIFSSPATRDRLLVNVNFVNDAGFTNVFLSTAACPTGTGAITQAAGTLSPLADEGVTWVGGIDLTNAITPSTFNVCARVNGTTAIERQAITMGSGLNLLAAAARDFAIGTPATLTNILFNGADASVFHINPAANVGQQTYIRITNRSTTLGAVRIVGFCDNGLQATTDIQFNLPGGNSVQLDAAELENGSLKTNNTRLTYGAACTGKRRINVTGEFAPMTVQNFLRNANTGGVVNTNINNEN